VPISLRSCQELLIMNTILSASVQPRDRALLSIMLSANLSPSHIAALDLADVREDERRGLVLRVRQAQPDSERLILLPADVADLVRAYLRETGRTLEDGGPLFVAPGRRGSRSRGRRLSGRAVDCLIRRCARACGIALPTSPYAQPALIGARLPRALAGFTDRW
jgi:site-specific recombinase XerD